MTVVKQLKNKMSLRRSLAYAGISHNKWYYSKTPRNMPVDKTVSDVHQGDGVKI